MKKYVVPVIECAEIKLSECIATCDGTCPADGYYMQETSPGVFTKVYLTALSTSMGA